VTVVDYFWYCNLIDTRTETWHGRTIVCGTELRPEIQNKYGSTIRKSRVRELLDDATGDPQLIWTDQSIRSSKDILCVSYLVIVPLIGGCIMAASQIAMCRAAPRSSTKPAKANKKNRLNTPVSHRPPGPRLSTWIVVVMLAMVSVPGAVTLMMVRSPGTLEIASSNPTPTATLGAAPVPRPDYGDRFRVPRGEDTIVLCSNGCPVRCRAPSAGTHRRRRGASSTVVVLRV
jgi:hypothetical protein